MKERFIQLGFDANKQFSAGGSERPSVSEHLFVSGAELTREASKSHTEGREVILMEPRGEIISQPPVEKPRVVQPPVPTGEQVITAQTIPDEAIREELHVDIDRFSTGKDQHLITRIKLWIRDLRNRRQAEQDLKKKRTEDEYVEDLVKFNTDVVGAGEGIREKDLLREAGQNAILRQAEADGYSRKSIFEKYVLREDAAVRPGVEQPQYKDRRDKLNLEDFLELKQDDDGTDFSTIDTSSIPEGPVRAMLDRHNKALRERITDTGQMRDLRNRLIELSHQPELGYTPEQMSAIEAAIDQLDEHIGKSVLAERAAEQAMMRSRRRDYMSIGQVFKGEQLARPEDIFIDRSVRDEVFNNLFANADSQTNEFFREAWNPLTDGGNYEEFMSDLRKASQGQISSDVLNEWITQYGSHTDEGQRIRDRFQGEDEYREKMKLMLQRELAGDLRRYSKERNVRKSLHDANAIINIPRLEAEQIFGYIEQFGSDLQDYAVRMPGVRQMMDIFETQTRIVMAENGGYLPPSAIQEGSRTEGQAGASGEFAGSEIDRPLIETRSKELFQKMLESGTIVLRDETNGRPIPIGELKPWQIDRVYATARGMSLLSMRLMSIAAESSLPPNGEYTSLFMQDALQIYSPYVHLMAKYYVPTDKALAALLYEPGRKELAEYISQGIPDDLSFLKKVSESLPNLRLPWSKKQMSDMYHMMHNQGAREMLEGKSGALLELRKQNPMRCGDAFTYLTWRAGTTPKDLTASREFLQKGRGRMEDRLSRMRSELGLTSEQEEAYRNEYGNWIGTGFRFERMREDLENRDPKAIEQAEKLLKRIVEIQPHRIYLKSKIIQERLRQNPRFAGLDMVKVQENLSFLETNMYRMREDLLEEGYTFDGEIGEKFTLQTIYDKISATDNGELPHHEAWGMTQEFIQLMQEDYDDYRDSSGSYTVEEHDGHTEKKYSIEKTGYLQEFIYERDYHHGYVLWSGDAPLEEFHFTAVGGTGGFIRRAGENKDVMGGTKGTLELLSHLHDQYTTPETVYAKLYEIYAANKNYDIAQAKKTITDITEGVIRFFTGQSVSRIPIFGTIAERTGHASFAQEVYGKEVGAVWSTTEVDLLVNKLMKPHMGLYPDMVDRLTKNVNSTKLDNAANIAHTLALLAAAAAILFVLKKGVVDEAIGQ